MDMNGWELKTDAKERGNKSAPSSRALVKNATPLQSGFSTPPRFTFISESQPFKLNEGRQHILLFSKWIAMCEKRPQKLGHSCALKIESKMKYAQKKNEEK